MDITYFYKYSDADGVTAISDKTFVDPIDAAVAAGEAEGLVYIRTEELFDVKGLQRKMIEERDRLNVQLKRIEKL